MWWTAWQNRVASLLTVTCYKQCSVKGTRKFVTQTFASNFRASSACPAIFSFVLWVAIWLDNYFPLIFCVFSVSTCYFFSFIIFFKNHFIIIVFIWYFIQFSLFVTYFCNEKLFFLLGGKTIDIDNPLLLLVIDK